jgi:uncharacterized protein YecT (DUF1311 family)
VGFDASFSKDLTMRPLFHAAALALSAFVAVAPALGEEVRPSQAVCDSKKIGGRDLADCLRAGADRADKELASVVEAAIKSIDSRQGLLSSQKARWRRSLNDAEAQWVSWRDSECQDVAPFEAGMAAKGGDPRLSCIIDYDAERVASLKARYP